MKAIRILTSDMRSELQTFQVTEYFLFYKNHYKLQ